jgi:hypothetical protein
VNTSALAQALGLDIQAQGVDVASKTLTQMAKRGEDPRPAFRTISDELRAAEVAWYASDGDHSWPSLLPETIEAKLRRGEPTAPMIATRALVYSLTMKRWPGAIRSSTRRQMKFGTKVYYARFHERGNFPNPVRKVLLPVDARTRRRMVNEVRDYMMGRTKGAVA